MISQTLFKKIKSQVDVEFDALTSGYWRRCLLHQVTEDFFQNLAITIYQPIRVATNDVMNVTDDEFHNAGI